MNKILVICFSVLTIDLIAQVDTCKLCIYKTFDDYTKGSCNLEFDYCKDNISTVFIFPPIAQNFAVKEFDAKMKIKIGDYWGFNFGGITYVAKELKSEKYFGPCWLKLLDIDEDGMCLYSFFRTNGKISIREEHTVLYFSTGINEPAYSFCEDALIMFEKDYKDLSNKIQQKFIHTPEKLSIVQKQLASELIKNRRKNFKAQY